jgi:hypothetical protein
MSYTYALHASFSDGWWWEMGIRIDRISRLILHPIDGSDRIDKEEEGEKMASALRLLLLRRRKSPL